MAADRKTGAHSRLLLPASHLINPNAAHLEAPRNLRRTIPALQGSQHALPQILRIGLHLRLPSTSRKYYRMKCIYVNRKRSRLRSEFRREIQHVSGHHVEIARLGIIRLARGSVFVGSVDEAGA